MSNKRTKKGGKKRKGSVFTKKSVVRCSGSRSCDCPACRGVPNAAKKSAEMMLSMVAAGGDYSLVHVHRIASVDPSSPLIGMAMAVNDDEIRAKVFRISAAVNGRMTVKVYPRTSESFEEDVQRLNDYKMILPAGCVQY